MRYIITALAVLGCALSPIPITARSHPHPHPHPHEQHDQQAAPSTHTPTPVEWTYLCFLNGNNNLDSYGDFNVQQMATVGSQPWLNIVVQQASLSRNDTKRLFVTQGKAQVVQDLGGGIEMGDVKVWEEFLQWGVTNYPANHYFLEIWDHGTGWYRTLMHKTGSTNKKPSLGDISCNNDFDRCITTTQLGDALSRFHQLIGRKADIFATDACLMQMIEIVGEFSDDVNYFVASEEVIPADGWPYDTFLKQWVTAGPAAHPRDIASFLTTQYLIAYTTGEYSTDGSYGAVTQSFLDLSYIQPVFQSIKALGQQIIKLQEPDRRTALAHIPQSICFANTDQDSCDIRSYTQVLGAALPQLQPVISQLDKDITNLVVQYGGTLTEANVTGLAIWLPANGSIYTMNNHNSQYETLKFEQITQWGTALRYIFTGNTTQETD